MSRMTPRIALSCLEVEENAPIDISFTEGLEYTATFATALYRRATGAELSTLYADSVALCTEDVRFYHLRYGSQVNGLLRDQVPPHPTLETNPHNTPHTENGNLCVNILDPEQCLLMLLMYGETFTSAVEILANSANIVIRAASDNECENYFRLRFESGRRVAVAVRKNLVSPHREATLAYAAILADVGLMVAPNETLTFARTETTMPYLHLWIPDHYHTVDLRTWYCSCDDYMRQQRYVSDGRIHYQAKNQSLFLTIDNTLVRRLVQAVAAARPTYCEIQNSLPVCSHLLALLILVFNPAKKRSYTIYDVRAPTHR